MKFTFLTPMDRDRVLVVGPSLGTSVTALWSACAQLIPETSVVGWDLPGHGASEPADGPFTVEELADELRRYVDPRPLHYAGVSLGGAVGFALADNPGPFDKVYTIASAPKIGDATAWHERAALVRAQGTEALVEGARQRWFAPQFADQSVVDSLLGALRAADDESYALACEALAKFDASGGRLPDFTAAGEHDPVVPPQPHHHVFAGCGHLPPAEDPRAVAEALTWE